MALQDRLALLPPGVANVGSDLAFVREDANVTFFNTSGPIYTCQENDRLGLRLAAAMFSEMEQASPAETGRAEEIEARRPVTPEQCLMLLDVWMRSNLSASDLREATDCHGFTPLRTWWAAAREGVRASSCLAFMPPPTGKPPTATARRRDAGEVGGSQ